jgi:hypothetical protein
MGVSVIAGSSVIRQGADTAAFFFVLAGEPSSISNTCVVRVILLSFSSIWGGCPIKYPRFPEYKFWSTLSFTKGYVLTVQPAIVTSNAALPTNKIISTLFIETSSQ